MSAKKEKLLRGLAYHEEFGANYPAAMRSGRELLAMKPSARKRRRLEAMIQKKIEKVLIIDSRYQDDNQ